MMYCSNHDSSSKQSYCQKCALASRAGRWFSLVWTVRARTSRHCYTEVGPPKLSKIMMSPRAGDLVGPRSTPTTARTSDTATDEIPQIAKKSVSRRLVGTALRPQFKHTVLKFSVPAFKRRIAQILTRGIRFSTIFLRQHPHSTHARGSHCFGRRAPEHRGVVTRRLALRK